MTFKEDVQYHIHGISSGKQDTTESMKLNKSGIDEQVADQFISCTDLILEFIFGN